MKIRSLRICSIRSIDELELDEIPDVVILAGPNGSGKSTVLDAIRAFKAAHATAVTEFPNDRGQLQTYSFGNVASDYPNLVSVNADSGTVTMTIALSEDEMQELGIGEAEISGSVVFSGPGNASTTGEQTTQLRQLFRQFPERLEHLPASRRFDRGQVTNLQLGSSAAMEARLRWSDKTTDKFQNFKSDLLMWDYLDSKLPRPGLSRIDGVKRVIKDFLVNKEFRGVEFREGMVPKFSVDTPRGVHEIEDLSSGEKEILMTLGTLVARELGHATVLWDEPDLHLHGTAEARLPAFIGDLSAQRNQVWVATHSPDVINSVDLDRHFLVHLPGGEAGENVGRRVLGSDEKVSTLADIGASLYVQTVFRKIVWHEGPTDEALLLAFNPDLRRHAAFIAAGGGAAVTSISAHSADLVGKALKDSTFIAIRDRDSDLEIPDETGTAQARMFVWRRREIENYLLDPATIKSVHDDHRLLDQFDTEDDARQELRSIADAKLDWVVVKTAERRINAALAARTRVTIDSDDPGQSLAVSRAEMIRQLDADLAETDMRRIHASTDAETRSGWNDDWASLCPGKQVLAEFHRRHVGGHMSYAQYCDTLAQTMARENRVPEDISTVITAIES